MIKNLSKVLAAVITMAVLCSCGESNEWISIFDGKSLEGWKAAENPGSWTIENGILMTNGPRSHLFYVGEIQGATFKNLEFSIDVMTTPGSNSGIYLHTEYQESGWPSKGYEMQIVNSYPDVEPGEYIERKMTGSIYAVRNVWKAPVRDNEWFNYRIKIQGKTIQTFINNILIAEYTESSHPWRPADMKDRLLSSGTIALQAHDPNSRVYFKNINVKPLPEELPTPGIALENTKLDSMLTSLAANNFPLLDLHVHLKGGLTIDEALAHARLYGFTYGIAYNCGLGMTFENDSILQNFLDNYHAQPAAFLAMQAEGREWLDLFSETSISEFDYIFTDAMTWSNDQGKRMRLWIPEETAVGDPDHFMDMLVESIVGILKNEPIDIYVNPTFLPAEISGRYEELWTCERMERVINALVENQVALEINDRYKIPSAAFICKAKKAGVKFTFGTNNGSRDDLGYLEYCLRMIQECGLESQDIWLP